jgi:hypothetical protein
MKKKNSVGTNVHQVGRSAQKCDVEDDSNNSNNNNNNNNNNRYQYLPPPSLPSQTTITTQTIS